MHDYVFVWMPFTGCRGEKRFIENNAAMNTTEAHEYALRNRDKWRKLYGDGQCVVCKVESYYHL